MYSGIEHETKSTKLSTRRIEIVEEYMYIYMCMYVHMHDIHVGPCYIRK